MRLAEETPQVKEVVSFEEESAACLNAIEVNIFIGGDDDSNVPLGEDSTESKDSAISCGQLNVDQVSKKEAEELACSSQSTYENVTSETANNGNESDGDEPYQDDFLPKDLLRFAWQISQGMVTGLFYCKWFEPRSHVVST